MTQEGVRDFAKIITSQIRDKAIKSSNIQLYSKNVNAPTAKAWREAKESGNIDLFAELIIADSVDDAIFHFLLAIDDGLFNLSFKSSDNKNINLSGSIIGELGGWFMA